MRSLRADQDSLAQEVEVGAAEHLAFECLDAADVAFDRRCCKAGWTRIDRDYETIRIDMQALFGDLGIMPTAAATA